MGAANLDKMVEKNRDLLEEKYWKCVGEEERNGEMARVELYRAGEPLVPVRDSNRYQRLLALAPPLQRTFGTGSYHKPVPKAARAGPTEPLVPVRITNRYQRSGSNRYEIWPAHCTFEPVPEPPLVPVRKQPVQKVQTDGGFLLVKALASTSSEIIG